MGERPGTGSDAAAPAAGAAAGGLPLVLPRGRHAAARDVVASSQRGRLLAAVATVVAGRGYAATAVADVIARAGVSRRTFYEHFANKEEAFLAAYDSGVEALLAAIDDGIAGAAPDWLAGAEAGTRRYLETLAARPEFARTFLVEVLAAGPRALARRDAVHDRFAANLARLTAAARADLTDLGEPPGHAYAACVGAVDELVTRHVREHGAERLPDLTPVLLDVQLALLVGREAAAAIRARR